MRKTPPSGVDEKHPDPRNEHVVQTPADAPITANSEIGDPSSLPMPIPSTSHTQHLAETVQQVGESVEDPEDEKEEMMLVTTVALGPHSEGCLLAGARREIFPSSPEWSTPTSRELIAKGVKVETDMLICDKRALVPLSLEESAFVPKERIVPSRMVLVENVMTMGIGS